MTDVGRQPDRHERIYKESSMTRLHFTYGSRGIAAYRWRQLATELGADHPATRAALGRLNYYRGMTPQKSSVSPEAIAWYRESAAQPGYWNRSRRRAARSAA